MARSLQVNVTILVVLSLALPLSSIVIFPVQFLNYANKEYRVLQQQRMQAYWDNNYVDNSAVHSAIAALTEDDIDTFAKALFMYIKQFNITPFSPYLRRQFLKLALLKPASILHPMHKIEMLDASEAIEKIYAHEILQTAIELEANETEENFYQRFWISVKSAARKMKEHFILNFDIANDVAVVASQLSGLNMKVTTFYDLWTIPYETPNLKTQVNSLMISALPIYKKLHAYARYHLAQRYSNVSMPSDGTIPAHLLMDGSWTNLVNIIPSMNPHPEVARLEDEVSNKLKNWTVLQLIQNAAKVFNNLGMPNMTSTFYAKSIFRSPADGKFQCEEAAVYDFCDGEDIRLVYCPDTVTTSVFQSVHRSLARIQYSIHYSEQPTVYREAATPAFEVAFGELFEMAVTSPEHLFKIGLLTLPKNAKSKAEILRKLHLNRLLKLALEKITSLPEIYVLERWCWEVFASELKEQDDMNRRWWKLILKYQGISPPIIRYSDDFDAGVMVAISKNSGYLHNFLGRILLFQFFEYMCSFEENVSMLHKCDFNENKRAGKSLIKMLKKGSSDTGANILKDFIGTEKIGLKSMKKYFEPLENFLDRFIDEKKIAIGWNTKVDDYVSPWNHDSIKNSGESAFEQTFNEAPFQSPIIQLTIIGITFLVGLVILVACVRVLKMLFFVYQQSANLACAMR